MAKIINLNGDTPSSGSGGDTTSDPTVDDNVVLKTDIVDDVISDYADKPLSANQGRYLKDLIDQLHYIVSSDDTDLDQLQEIVNYIKQNKQELESLSIDNIAGLQDELDELIKRQEVYSSFSGTEEGSVSQDPNTTVYENIVTNHINTPDRGKHYWHIRTQFFKYGYGDVNRATGNRSQIAIQYSGVPKAFVRFSYKGGWSHWEEISSSRTAHLMNPLALNPNPYFFLEDFDYLNFLKYSDGEVIVDYKEADRCMGSLKFNNGYYASLKTDTFLPVPSSGFIKVGVSSKFTKNGIIDPDSGIKIYMGIDCYDVKNNHIAVEHYVTPSKTGKEQGVLVNDLKEGDTTITIRGVLDDWSKTNRTYIMALRFYKTLPDGRHSYINEDGLIYPDRGYSRWLTNTSLWDDSENDIVDNGDGTFTISLAEPWSYSNYRYDPHPPEGYKAGDFVMQPDNGYTYPYLLRGQEIYPNRGDFVRAESPWTEIKQPTVGGDFVIRAGTAKIKPLLLPHYYVKGDDGSWTRSTSEKEKYDSLWYSALTLEVKPN